MVSLQMRVSASPAPRAKSSPRLIAFRSNSRGEGRDTGRVRSWHGLTRLQICDNVLVKTYGLIHT